LALEYGFTYHQNGGLLIGYDYDCHKPSGCSGNFKSLDGKTLLNPIASEFNSKLGKSFKSVKGNEIMILSNGSIKTESFDSVHINSVACETSFEVSGQLLTCGTTFNDLQAFGTMMVICPGDCVKLNEYKVYGTTVYAGESSVCRSIEHIGIYTKFEEFKFAIITPEKSLISTFINSDSNGIKSESISGKSTIG